ncbi:hypothetical protein LNK15_15615, partial [Jeotgalicoccus huakuii]|nr:hypothetical protein [Jeotgalicoccus huakuii]
MPLWLLRPISQVRLVEMPSLLFCSGCVRLGSVGALCAWVVKPLSPAKRQQCMPSWITTCLLQR